jgi:hypothetical protein
MTVGSGRSAVVSRSRQSQSAAEICVSLMLVVASSTAAVAQTAPRRPLTVTDIDSIAQLVMLEDTRRFDEAALATL